jgi:hypothetical protein
VREPADLHAALERHTDKCWAGELEAAAAWPWTFPLGLGPQPALELDTGALTLWASSWRTWAQTGAISLTTRVRRVHGTALVLPTHASIDGLDAAGNVLGGRWPAKIEAARTRAAALREAFPGSTQVPRVVRAMDGRSDVDLDLLVRASNWFLHNDATGLTPRQVPIEGLHAKWLNTRRSLIRDLTGLDDLRLAPAHPARLHFTYLDPEHLDSGGRRHDSASVGDRPALAYQPRIVVISENKDTAIGFPRLPGAVSVEGVGKGGGTAASFDWIREAALVVYWGDMDADGLEILNEFRASGLPAHSILMNLQAYDQWCRFGSDTDALGRPIGVRAARPVPHLTEAEAHLYGRLLDPDWTGHRRIEQERIPLAHALSEVRMLIAQI